MLPISGIALILGSALPPIPNVGSLAPTTDVGPSILVEFLVPAAAGLTPRELREKLEAIPEEAPARFLGEMGSAPDGRHVVVMWVPERWRPRAQLEAVRRESGIEEAEFCVRTRVGAT